MLAINNILSEFDAISLGEMDRVALMNRVDTKYVFSEDILNEVLKKIKDDYFVLEVDNIRLNSYQSLYFDTKDFKFYYQHHNGKTNRTKVRYREYMDSGLCFLEVKQKNNKGVTNKKRMLVPKINQELSCEQKEYIRNFIDDDIEAKHLNTFHRITLVSKKEKERLTIDVGVKFSVGDYEAQLENMVIAEVKQEKVNYASPFIRFLKVKHINPFRISKYCMATASLFPHLKQNNFKKKFLRINKIKTND